MPFLVATPAAAAVTSAAIGAGAGLFGAKKASDANKAGSAAQAKATAEALAFAKEQEATRIREKAAQDAAEKAQYDALEARRAPFRAAAYGVLGQSADQLGINLGSLGGYDVPSRTERTPTALPSPYAQGSLGSLAGYQVPTADAAPMPPDLGGMTLADIAKLKRAGDWRTA